MYYEPVRRYSSQSTSMIRLTDFPDDILEEVFHAMRGLMCFPGERELEVRSRIPTFIRQAHAVFGWRKISDFPMLMHWEVHTTRTVMPTH